MPDWIAMLMPSATSGWASPAALPTAKKRPRASVRMPGPDRTRGEPRSVA